VIAADEVAAEGLAHARTLKMTSVDPTDAPLGRSWFAHHDVMLRRHAPLDPWFDKTS
jgi:hypothetical protein